METKTFSGYLYLNWKDDEMKLRKSSPKTYDAKPYEKAVKVSVDVKVPEQEVPEISKVLEVPEVEVREAVGELVELDGVHEEHPNPNEILMHDEDYLFENFPERHGGEITSNDIEWLRSLLAYEYKNSYRDRVVEFLESRLSEYKEKCPDKVPE